MVQIFPSLNFKAKSPINGNVLNNLTIRWQGVHLCVEGMDTQTNDSFLTSLPVAQGYISPYQYHIQSKRLFANGHTKPNWFNSIMTDIAENGSDEKIEINFDVREKFENILILNTVDFLFGHSLLFLFQVQKLIEYAKGKNMGVVVIVQPFLKWLIPTNGVAEVWTANIPLKKGKIFFKDFDKQLNSRITEYKNVFISEAPVQPTNIKIENFTGINPYQFNTPPQKPRITFIWREDPNRMWCKNWLVYGGMKYFKIQNWFKPIHLYRVKKLMKKLHKMESLKNYQLSIAGLGKHGSFAPYIEDCRVNSFDVKAEIATCNTYAESILVVGIHGSSMILPTAHSGMAISIMPHKRWGNFGQDILYTETDVVMAGFQRRVVPIRIPMQELADIVEHMVTFREGFYLRFVKHNQEI